MVEDWATKFYSKAILHKNIEVFIPRFFNIHEDGYMTQVKVELHHNQLIKLNGNVEYGTNAFPGGAALVNRSKSHRLGLYDEMMSVGFEDREMCIRALIAEKPIKTRLIDNITLVSGHKYQVRAQDRRAIRERYRIKTLHKLYNRIIQKHHVVLQGNWQSHNRDRGGHFS